MAFNTYTKKTECGGNCGLVCHGHEIKLEYQNTADVGRLIFDAKESIVLDWKLIEELVCLLIHSEEFDNKKFQEAITNGLKGLNQ